jgi:hypothetical protein
MAVTVASASSAQSSSGSVTVARPSSVTAGNLLVAFVYAPSLNTGGLFPFFGGPAGPSTGPFDSDWAQAMSNVPASHAGNAGLLYKWATTTEPSSYTFTCQDSVGFIQVDVLNLSGAGGFDGAAVFNASTSGSIAALAPSLTPTRPGDLLLCGYGLFNGAATGVPAFAGPSAMTAGPATSFTATFYDTEAGTAATGGRAAIPADLSSGYTAMSVLVYPTPTTGGYFRGAFVADYGSTGANVDLLVPAATAAGDLMVAVLYMLGDVSQTLTTPSGWTVANHWTDTTYGSQAYTYTRTATGSEPASYRWTWSAGGSPYNAGLIACYAGALAVDVGPSFRSDSGSNGAAASLTPTLPGDIWLVYTMVNGTSLIPQAPGVTMRGHGFAGTSQGLSLFDELLVGTAPTGLANLFLFGSMYLGTGSLLLRTTTSSGGGSTVSSTVALGPVAVTATGTSSGSTVSGTATLNLGPFTISVASSLETLTGTAALPLGPLIVGMIGARPGAAGLPVPGYRGRWRLTLHTRTFAPAPLMSTIIAELADARARKLDQNWNQPAQLTFTLDGRSQAAGLVQELLHDVVAWRWDELTGQDWPVFRGPVTQSQDSLDEQAHTVVYTCHDYAALLTRRLLTSTYSVTGRDQDLIAGDLLQAASFALTSGAISLSPASYLPMSLVAVGRDGALRGLSGQTRDRTYYGSQNVGTAFTDLAVVSNGYDWDVRPSAANPTDSLRIFYPNQGVTRSDGIALQYGSTVATVQRNVDSASYANLIRVLGNNSSSAPTPQLFSEGRTFDAATSPAGLWMLADDAADVTVAQALLEKAQGDLNLYAVLVPSYTLGLAPGAYTWGSPNMGDTVPLLIQSGRLGVNTTIRVLGISYLIGDDGQEDVTLTVGRPRRELVSLLGEAASSVQALTRR